MKIINIAEYGSFDELYVQYEQKKDSNDLRNLLLLFIASDDPLTKESWCSDCRDSKPVIDKVIGEFQYNEQLALAIVQVGDRDVWKRDDNPFRKHKLQINAVPTLLSLKTILHLGKPDANHPRTSIMNTLNAVPKKGVAPGRGGMCRRSQSISSILE